MAFAIERQRAPGAGDRRTFGDCEYGDFAGVLDHAPRARDDWRNIERVARARTPVAHIDVTPIWPTGR